ncbi:MAG: dTDP-4-dehydrorhamnose reductase [Candidatus Omnitrophica bacterium]|nr:dTDP-4-dehydrorhamnose reductase [Candidatus Omnitrophota bacterium]
MKRRVLITGSGGMLGIDLCKELESAYKIYGADVIPGKNFVCNITNKDSVSGIISKIRPDVVIHSAAWTDVDGCELNKVKAFAINADGTRNVASACRQSGAVLIYISTDFVFDGKKKAPYKEPDEPHPLNIYAESKLKGEEIVKKLDKYFIIRTSWLYGKNGKNFVDTIIKKSKTEKDLKVVDDQIGSPTYTVDLSKAIHALLDKIADSERWIADRSGIYHVANSGAISWFGYAETILRLTGSDAKVSPISSEKLNRPATRPAMSVLDNAKFTGLTGYKMRDWQTALKDYLDL